MPHPPLHRLIKPITGRGRGSCPSDPRGACTPPRVVSPWARGHPGCGRVAVWRGDRPRTLLGHSAAPCRPSACTPASRPCWKAPRSRRSAGGAGARRPRCPRSCAASCPSTRPPWTSCGSSRCTPRSPPRCWPTSSSSPALCSSTSCWTRVRPGRAPARGTLRPRVLCAVGVLPRGPAAGGGTGAQGRAPSTREPPGWGGGPRAGSPLQAWTTPLCTWGAVAATAPARCLHPPSSWRGAQKRASRLGNQKASRLSSEASSGGARAQGTRWPGGGQASRPHLPCTPRPLSELLPLAPRRPGLRPAAAAPGLDEERRLRGGGRALLPEAFLHPPPAGHAPRPAHPGRRTRLGRWGWGPHAVALGSLASKLGGGRRLRSEAGKWPHSAPSPCPTPATPLGRGLCRGGGRRA